MSDIKYLIVLFHLPHYAIRYLPPPPLGLLYQNSSSTCPSFKRQQSWFGLFCFITFPILPPPPQFLEPLFEEFPKQVLKVAVMMDSETGNCRGFGFVTIASVREAALAIKFLNGVSFLGKTLRANFALRQVGGGGGLSSVTDSYGQYSPKKTGKSFFINFGHKRGTHVVILPPFLRSLYIEGHFNWTTPPPSSCFHFSFWFVRNWTCLHLHLLP